MNDRDTERMSGMLAEMGYERSVSPDDADLVLINTCSVREKPVHKVYSALGRLRRIKESRPEMLIGVTGCVAQQMGPELLKKVPYLDMVIGTRAYHKLPDIIAKAGGRYGVSETSMDDGFDNALVMEAEKLHWAPNGTVSALVSIMKGCNNYCSYCIVPYVRGPEASRSLESILSEITELADNRVKEVTLIGQNVNSYGLGLEEGVNFPELLRKVAEIKGIKRIRFTTSHPKDFSEELIDTVANEPKVCKMVHLPAQSGSTRILELMKRGYTSENYLGLVGCLNSRVKDLAVTSDLIVGFPGETEDDFEATLRLIKKARYDNIFSFKFSPRPGTPAAEMDGQLPEAVKVERLKILQQLQEEITREVREGYVGREVEVLVSGPDRNDQGKITGRTTTNIPVNFYGSQLEAGHNVGPGVDNVLSEGSSRRASGSLTGEIVNVRVTKALRHSLEGKAVDEA